MDFIRFELSSICLPCGGYCWEISLEGLNLRSFLVTTHKWLRLLDGDFKVWYLISVSFLGKIFQVWGEQKKLSPYIMVRWRGQFECYEDHKLDLGKFNEWKISIKGRIHSYLRSHENMC